jgi:Kdo2-lipid IVA lauroyltransferase/acyltransferase
LSVNSAASGLYTRGRRATPAQVHIRHFRDVLLHSSRLVSRLPLRLLHATGALLGRLALAASASHRRKLQGNLDTAGLGAPGRAEAAAREAGRAALEAPYVWFRTPEQLARKVRVEGEEALDAAIGAGRGVIFLTPHLGCFEVAARTVARRCPITVLYKPPRLAAARTLVEAARQGRNLKAVPANATGVRGLLRALKRGEAIGVLPDQVPSDGDGVWVPFFGRPAYTMTLPQRLAALTGAAVVMAVGERLPAGRGWTVHFEPLHGDPSPGAVNAAMEALIRRFPEQYFWGYNRYKAPPQAEPRPGASHGDAGRGPGVGH